MGLLDSLLCKENYLADFPLGPTGNTVISVFIHRTATARAEGRGDGMTTGIERETMGYQKPEGGRHSPQVFGGTKNEVNCGELLEMTSVL